MSVRQQHCDVEGCSNRHRSNGFCKLHLDRWRRHGSTEIGQSGRPPKAEHPSWYAVHKRLSRSRGPARLHDCVDCGKRAFEWSYDNADPNELRTNVGGSVLGYSLDLARYAPRCRSCHRRFDFVSRTGDNPRTEIELWTTEWTR